MTEYRYFSGVSGAAVPRFGHQGTWIGAELTSTGFKWNEDAVVAVAVRDVELVGLGIHLHVRGPVNLGGVIGGPVLVIADR